MKVPRELNMISFKFIMNSISHSINLTGFVTESVNVNTR